LRARAQLGAQVLERGRARRRSASAMPTREPARGTRPPSCTGHLDLTPRR